MDVKLECSTYGKTEIGDTVTLEICDNNKSDWSSRRKVLSRTAFAAVIN